MAIPSVTLGQGVHVCHLFFRIDRVFWNDLPEDESQETLKRLEAVVASAPGPAAPRIMTFAGVGGKSDLGFLIIAKELQELSRLEREVQLAFPPGTLQPVFSYLSVTELPEYVATDDDLKAILAREGVVPGHPEFPGRFEAAQQRNAGYQHYRLYPELEPWEIMCFYPMSKKRQANDNWYSLDFPARKLMMSSHAKTGRKYAGRISQLITGSTGLDDWEWGVTLMAHQLDAVKEIVYEMRFDEVTARFGDFGPFFVNLTLSPSDLWDHLQL